MKIIDKKMIYNASAPEVQKRFSGTPSVLLLSNGSILCSFKIGSGKIATDDNIIIFKSLDFGKTWQQVFFGFDTVVGICKGSIHSCYISEIEPGRLFALCCWVDRSKPSINYCNPATGGILKTMCILYESFDCGNSWRLIDIIDFGFHHAAVPTSRILRLTDGNLLLSYENWKSWSEIKGNYSSAVLLSSDNGNTWSWPIIAASDPFERYYYWDIKFAIHPESNNLYGFAWTRNNIDKTDMPIHIIQGSKNAMYWNKPFSTKIKGQSAFPMFIDKHRLLVIYVDRDGHHGSIKAMMSLDLGETWTDEIEFGKCCSGFKNDDVYGSFIGGPEALNLNGESILIVYYSGDSQQLSINMVRTEI